ncbi:condensation domain-containing protein, partial [Streptomyces sp. NPDC056405]|uniref:condensation domain-containing protein n=1 Tax=Streptomyces sp. NPDC056405 TaxID=3345811 RepID=UPI0035DE2BCA
MVSLEAGERARLEQAWRHLDTTGEGPVADVLPLGPLQQGMLFHAGFAEGADAYTVQKVFGLSGPLTSGAFRHACQAVVERHTALRAGFTQSAAGEPLQLVARHVEVPVHEHDLRGLPPEERDRRLADLLARDKRTRFDMSAPPLLRFSLIRLADERHLVALSSHHILFDGWSVPLILRDVLAFLHGEEAELPAPVPLRAFLAWAASQDRTAAEQAWRGALADLDGPTLVAPARPAPADCLPGLLVTELPAGLTAAVESTARTRGLTLNTVI